MESSGYMGMVAVVAVSGSVALVALQLHKRLMLDFLKKVQFEIGHGDNDEKNDSRAVKAKMKKKKKVAFAADVVEPSSDNKNYRRRMSRH